MPADSPETAIKGPQRHRKHASCRSRAIARAIWGHGLEIGRWKPCPATLHNCPFPTSRICSYESHGTAGINLTVLTVSAIIPRKQLRVQDVGRAERIAKVSGPATYQDVLDAPPHMVAEVVAGILHTQPGPAKRHAWASSVMGVEIGAPFGRGKGGPGGWLIMDNPELHLAEDIIVPDIAGWRLETMSEDMEGAHLTQAPDWVCEVLSPPTRQFDLDEKRAEFARERVRHLRIPDPDTKSLEVFELHDGLRVLLATPVDDAPVSLPPFDAISFPPDALWPEIMTSAAAGDENA